MIIVERGLYMFSSTFSLPTKRPIHFIKSGSAFAFARIISFLERGFIIVEEFPAIMRDLQSS